VSESSGEFAVDPWAWLREVDAEAEPDFSGFNVVAAVVAAGGDAERCLAAVHGQDVEVDAIVTELGPDTAGDWIWIIPDDTEPTPATLSMLLARVLKQPEGAIFGCLLIEPRRRGAGRLVSDWAQTISGNGRVRLLTEPGELYQGQLHAGAVLGVPAAGMLVRGDAWRFLGGFNERLPRNLWGLDFGWRANLTGYVVVADPEAQLINYAGFADPAQERAAGFALRLAHTRRPLRWLVAVRLAVVGLLVSLGYLLGKDPDRASEEIRAVWRWATDRSLRRSLNAQLAALPIKASGQSRTRELLPARGSGLRRAFGLTAARFLGWLETFTDAAPSVSIDEMTGDDFADRGSARQRIPVVLIGIVTLVLGALLAARNSYGAGELTGTQLLAAPAGWLDLVDSYLSPVAGSAGAGAPWTALAGVFSLITLGNPDWLVTVVLVLAVPLAWVTAYRLARQLVADHVLAALGALGYALTPALIGGLNAGSFGLAAFAILLPVLGYSLRTWLRHDAWSWRAAGAVGFWLLLACSLVPLVWVVAAVAAVVSAARARRTKAWFQWLLVLASPLLLFVSPWGQVVLRFPGRLLTGVEPALAPTDPVPAWTLLVGQSTPGGAPLWLGIGFFAVCWLGGFAGAVRRPSLSLPAFGLAVGSVAVAVAVTRFVVQVPPGSWVRPQALEWQLLVAAGLLLAAVRGLDRIMSDLAGAVLGLRHAATLGIAILSVAALAVATGWWALAGQLGLSRGEVGVVPAFVRSAQVGPTPGRTLAMVSEEGRIRWGLLEGDFARLGDTERGSAFGGSDEAQSLAASVATRLLSDSADDEILPDLVRLGVSYVSLAGGEPSQRISINNTPGLGLGTGNDDQFVWPVPDSARAMITDGDTRSATGPGASVPVGDAQRVLQLAEPADPRWLVKVGDETLATAAPAPPGTAFALGTAGGTLTYALDEGPRWWAWVQLAGLALLALVAAPSVRRRAELAPRRIAGGAQ
jgi:hypothetical protein